MRERYEDFGVCRCCFLRDVCKERKCDLIKTLLGELPFGVGNIKLFPVKGKD